ncbi:MAG: LytR C-terminal domain-containing protein [Patescibacteria group bacterium]
MIPKTVTRAPRVAVKKPVALPVSSGSCCRHEHVCRFILVAAIFVGVFAILVSSLSAVTLRKQGRWMRQMPRRDVSVMMDQSQAMMAFVRGRVSVNANEMPVVQTIQDVEALRPQNLDFYKEAQPGDRLLIWSDKTVLVSSSCMKILAVLPVRLAGVAVSSTGAVAPLTESAKVEVRNGTRTVGLARKVSDRIKADGMTVGTIATARSTRYPNTLIVTAEGKAFPETVAKLQGLIGGSATTTMPVVEGALKGDVLVIIGADYK